MDDADLVMELLERVRATYVTHFDASVAALRREFGTKLLVQPMLRGPGGEPWIDGVLGLPYRKDVAVLSGTTSSGLSIDSPQVLKFEPLKFAIRGETDRHVTIAPFCWDGAELIVTTDRADLDWAPLRACFTEWLKPTDDEGSPELRVAHFLSDPQRHHGGFRFEVDLGTADAEAAYDILLACLDCGAQRVSIQ